MNTNKVLSLLILALLLITPAITACESDSSNTQNNGDYEQQEAESDQIETDRQESDSDQSVVLCKDFPKAFCFEGLQSGTKCEDGVFYYCSPTEPVEPDCVSVCECEERECDGYCKNYAPGQAKCHQTTPDGDLDQAEQDTSDNDIVEFELEKDKENISELDNDFDKELESELDLEIYDPHEDCKGSCDFESFEPLCIGHGYLCRCYEADNTKFPINCVTHCANPGKVFDRCDYNESSVNDCICTEEKI